MHTGVIQTNLSNKEKGLEEMNPPFFTIFTATYNRKHLLPRAYESVKKQTFRDFEWLIIDDGSSDGTEELVKQWQAEADFPIVYKWKPNGGKHTAFNMGAKFLRGEITVGLDSDDEMLPITLERYKYHWDKLSPDVQNTIGCLMSLNLDQEGNKVGVDFPEPVMVTDFMKLYLTKGIRGEKAVVVVSKVFQMYPYPEGIKNVYIPEGVFLHKLSKNWKTLCFNEVLRTYWLDKRSDHDGDRMKTKANYPGNRLYHLAYINYSMRLFWGAPRIFIANAVYFTKLSLHLGIGIGKQFREITSFGGRLLWMLTLPIGYFLYLRDRDK